MSHIIILNDAVKNGIDRLVLCGGQIHCDASIPLGYGSPASVLAACCCAWKNSARDSVPCTHMTDVDETSSVLARGRSFV